MTYLKRSNLGKKRSRSVTLIILGALAVLVAVDFIFPSFYPSLVMPIASSTWHSEDATVGIIGRAFSLISSKLTLVRENYALRDELRSHEADTYALSVLREENEALKTALGRKTNHNEVLGAILSRPPVSPYDTLVIDAGMALGVIPGQKVYVNGTVLIGDVVQSTRGNSTVSLFSSPGREVSVLIGDDKVETQAVGRGGGNFIARLPADITVAEGDVVVAPQLRDNVFGLVEKVEVGATDSIQTIYFRAPFNMHELRYVEVDKGN